MKQVLPFKFYFYVEIITDDMLTEDNQGIYYKL